MKNSNVRIAIIEEGNFYNRLIENQIFDLCHEKQFKSLNWVIKSFDDPEVFKRDSKTIFQAVLIDNYYKTGNKQIKCNVPEIIEEVKRKNDNCLFITISGYREMLITGEFYVDGQLHCFYSKQSSHKEQNFEENCSIPSIYKLMEKFICCRQEKVAEVITSKKVSARLRISA